MWNDLFGEIINYMRSLKGRLAELENKNTLWTVNVVSALREADT